MVKTPEGWIETTLREIIDTIIDNRGKNPDYYVESGIPVIDNVLIKDNRQINLNEAKRFIDDYIYNNFIRKYNQPGDVIMTLVGNGYGNISLFPNKKSVIIQNTIGLRTNHQSINLFVYYLLKYKKREILELDIGAAQPSIKVGDLLSINITLPPLPEQKAIAGALSSFDDKIELLRAENQTLEEMGQTLFKERFGKYRIGDELPNGWKVGKLGDYCETVLGGTPSREKNEYWGGNIPWINSGKVNENRIVEASEYITEEGLSKSATKLMPEGTVLIAITGATLGQYSILCIDSCFNQSVVGIRESEKFKKEFLYYFIGETIKDLINNQTGGAQQHINKQVVDNHNMIIPTDEILEKYYEISEPIFNKITENLFQIKSLSKTRDQLLPKLMSGEVRVEF